jgi:hypothetical protein
MEHFGVGEFIANPIADAITNEAEIAWPVLGWHGVGKPVHQGSLVGCEAKEAAIRTAGRHGAGIGPSSHREGQR